MKNLLLLFLLAVPFILKAQEMQLYETLNYKNAVENGTRSRNGRPGPNYWQNHADYHIEVRLDTAKKKIFGKEKVTYYNESPDTLNWIIIRLYHNKFKKGAIRNITMNPTNVHEGVVLDSLAFNGKGVDLKDYLFRSFGTNLIIRMPEALKPGEKLHLYCEWNYKPPTGKQLRRSGFYKDNAWFIAYFYPQIAVYDDLERLSGPVDFKGWDVALFHQGRSEVYNDFNNYRVKIIVPEGFYVWATGKHTNTEDVFHPSLLKRIHRAKNSEKNVPILTGKDMDKNWLLSNEWHFEAEHVPDFAFGTAQDYLWEGTSVAINDRKIFVDVAYHPDSELYSEALDIARASVEYASVHYPAIPFPYEKSTTFNGNLSGGMEFPMIANNGSIPEKKVLRNIIFHEIFHNYLPFMTGINEKKYPFLDEGWTEFYSNRFLEDTYNTKFYHGSGEPSHPLGNKGIYEIFASNQDFPLIHSYSQLSIINQYYLTYIKPAMAYEFFVDMVGRERFMRAFQEFANRWNGKHPTAWDFFYTFNDVLGENYNWFWKAWFFDLGYPDLGLELDGEELIVKRVGVGALPLPVKLKLEKTGGSFETITRPMDVWKNGEKQIRIRLNNWQEIKTVRIDPESIPDMDHSNNIISID